VLLTKWFLKRCFSGSLCGWMDGSLGRRMALRRHLNALNAFCSYSVFRSVFVFGRCTVNMNSLTSTLRGLSISPRGHSLAKWLRHYATGRKVKGSIPDEVIEFFSIYIILPASLDSEVYSDSNRNEYQKQKNIFWGVENGRCLGLTTPQPFVSRLFRQ
jgi:hypothetical protein